VPAKVAQPGAEARNAREEALAVTGFDFAPALGDTLKTLVGTAGAISSQFAAAVGFDPKLNASQLVINGQLVLANVTGSMTSLKLERTIVGASTLTLTVEDPDRVLLNSPFASITSPAQPITVVPDERQDGVTLAGGNVTSPAFKPTRDNYYPTVASLSDGTTTLNFALVEIGKQGNTLTLTFEDQLINQLRYCFSPTGLNIPYAQWTRADFMSYVISKAMKQLSGNVVQPKLLYPTAAALQQANPGASTAIGSATDLVWGDSANPDQDAWSFLTQAANDAQWRAFSTGTAIVFGPDAWLLSAPVCITLQEYQNGVGFIDFDWDIGQAEANCTVNCFTGKPLTFSPGAVAAVANLGVVSAQPLWLVSDMTRELHLPTCTVTLAQAQPALTEAQIASTNGTTSTVTGTNPAGQAIVTPTIPPTTGESAAAATAVAWALKQVGKPYIYGGNGPGGYDCSGLTYWAYNAAGISIPRTSEDQAAAGFIAVTPTIANLIPGDLVFYNLGEDGVPGPGHVVMYIGSGDCVEAPHTGSSIKVTGLPAGAISARRPAPKYGAPVTGA
jgi:cell wall-associated NlpC family hydrolase